MHSAIKINTSVVLEVPARGNVHFKLILQFYYFNIQHRVFNIYIYSVYNSLTLILGFLFLRYAAIPPIRPPPPTDAMTTFTSGSSAYISYLQSNNATLFKLWTKTGPGSGIPKSLEFPRLYHYANKGRCYLTWLPDCAVARQHVQIVVRWDVRSTSLLKPKTFVFLYLNPWTSL